MNYKCKFVKITFPKNGSTLQQSWIRRISTLRCFRAESSQAVMSLNPMRRLSSRPLHSFQVAKRSCSNQNYFSSFYCHHHHNHHYHNEHEILFHCTPSRWQNDPEQQNYFSPINMLVVDVWISTDWKLPVRITNEAWNSVCCKLSTLTGWVGGWVPSQRPSIGVWMDVPACEWDQNWQKLVFW